AKNRSVLWSHGFESAARRSADLQHQSTLTAGRVLDCWLEAQEKQRLRRDLLKLFLSGCAELAEGDSDKSTVAETMSKIVAEEPNFTPAWSRLLLIQVEQLMPEWVDGGKLTSGAVVEHSIQAARKADPNLPEVYIAESELLPPTAYGRRLALIERARK